MRSLKELSDRVLHRPKKGQNTKLQSGQKNDGCAPDGPTPDPAKQVKQPTCSITQSQSEISSESVSAHNLWEDAFAQLGEKEKNILLQQKSSLQTPEGDRDPPRTTEVIHEVIQKTEKQYEAYLQKGIKIKRSTGEDIDLRNVSQKIINAALSFKDVISTVAACDPTGHAASAWTLVSFGLTMTQNASERRDAVFDSPEYLADILARCAYIEKNFYRGEHGERQTIGDALVNTYKPILQYTAEILTIQKSGTGKALLDSVTAASNQHLTQLQSSIQQEEQKLHQWIHLDQHLQFGEKAESILTRLDEISRNLQTLVQKFSLPIAKGACFDDFENQHDVMCLPNTRVNLLCRISEWVDSPTSDCIFWLSGMAGTGKSTISRTVARSFEEKGKLGASFFFKKGEPDRGNATKFVSSLAKQLINRHHHLAPEVLKAIDTDPEISHRNLREQFKKLLLLPLQNQKSSQSSDSIVIVIDALDECDDDKDIELILELLPLLQTSTSYKLKVFLTSRPELPIRFKFQRIDGHQDLILDQGDTAEIARDINLFLEHTLSQIREDNDLPLGWPGIETMKELTQLSIPLFIFAATLCRFVGDGIRPPEDRLKTILQPQAESQISPAKKMESIYRPILEQASKSSDRDESQELEKELCEIVGTIILFAKPLSVHDLGQFLGRSSSQINFLLKKLHSVLRVPESIHSPVRILHLSFREFLLHTTCSFHVNEQEMNRRMALQCFRVMDDNLKRNICDLRSYCVSRKKIPEEVIDEHLPVHAQYSCQYWVHHVENSKGCMSDFDILAFLKKHLLHWLEAMSLMGAIADVIGVLDKLQSGQKTSADTELQLFLYDAKRFVLQNHHMIDKAPLQLYCSGLTFAPTESIVRAQFQHEAIRDIKVFQVSQAPRTWSANLQALEGHSKVVVAVAFSPDSQTVASSSMDCSIKLWDVKTGKRLHSLREHSTTPGVLAFSPDGQTIASADSSSVRIWDATKGEQVQAFENLPIVVRYIIFSADSQSVILACNGYVKSWSCRTDRELWTQEVAEYPRANHMALSSAAPMVALTDAHSSVKIWDYKIGKEVRELSTSTSHLYSMAFSPDGLLLAVAGADIQIWHIESGKQLRVIKLGPISSVWDLDFSPDSQTVIALSGLSIQLWDVETGKMLRTFSSHSEVASMSFSSDGQTIATGSRDGIVKLWDAKANEGEQILIGAQDMSRSSAPLSNGERVRPNIVSSDGSVNTLSVAVSPDAQTVASSFTGGSSSFKIWDGQSGKELRTFEYPSEITGCMVFSPDSEMIAFAPGDSTIRMWNVKTREGLQTLIGHTGNVRALSFSPDSQMIVSCTDNDDTLKLWHVKEGKELRTLDQKSSGIDFVKFSPGGQAVVCELGDYYLFSGDGMSETMTLWDIKTGKRLDISEDRSPLYRSVSYQYPQRHDHLRGSLSTSGRWLTHENKRLLWLPSEYRECECMDMQNGVVVMGYHDGRVLIIRLGCEKN